MQKCVKVNYHSYLMGEFKISSKTRTIKCGKYLEKIKEGEFIYRFNEYPLPINLFLSFKSAELPLIVFGQGMQNRDKPLPYFQRMSWRSQLECNCLFISDPTLSIDPSISLGWCLGTHEWHALPAIVRIIKNICALTRIQNTNIIFYGSSAGGFTSLMMSSLLKSSRAFVNNPQTDVLKFKRGGVKKLLNLAFDGISLEEAKTLYPNRFSVIKNIEMGMGDFRETIYLQNICDEDHRDDQMMPFINSISKASGDKKIHLGIKEMIDFRIYNWPEGLHNPLGSLTILPLLKEFAGIT